MKARDFMYWFQGFAELHSGPPTTAQWEIIKNHLNLVFVHDIDPTMPDPNGELQAAHDGKPPRPQFGGIRPDGTVMRC